MIHSIVIEFNDKPPHRFTLGLGPCGREVAELSVIQEIPGVLEVGQTCSDNPDEPDWFGYPLHNVARYKIYNTDNPEPSKAPKH